MVYRDFVLRVALGSILLGGSAGALRAADPGVEFYNGKTVTYVVATSPATWSASCPAPPLSRARA